MKKLNIIFSFVLLSFCLLINVSNAIEPNYSYTVNKNATSYFNSTEIVFGDYTGSQVKKIMDNYANNPSDVAFKEAFDNLVQVLEENNKNYVFGSYSQSSFPLLLFYWDKEIDLDFCALSTTGGYSLGGLVENTTGNESFYIVGAGSRVQVHTPPNGTTFSCYWAYDATGIFLSSVDIYSCLPGTSTDYMIWDGESYLYKVQTDDPDEPETPTMPSNSEIASAVQMFYNSVYNLPNIAFDDFVVLYDNTTGLYTYIGHTLGTALGQVIVEPNGYFEGYKYDVQWWKFFIDEQNDNFLDQFSNYYVYTSDGTIENLKYVGDSNISGLIEKSGPWATAKTVIVYSTNDYPVKYVTFSDDSPDPVIQTGTIQGDQYTYDENLDITDNHYNPLDNFVSINYPSTLVGNADFDSFLNTFNENKDVLILPQNANWVILANTSLFSYFGSFIIMCTLFIIIERIMRG